MKAFFQKCLYRALLGLELICHSWNINRNKSSECPEAGTFPAQSPHRAALYGQERQRFGTPSHGVNFPLLTVSFTLCRDTTNSLGENSKAPTGLVRGNELCARCVKQMSGSQCWPGFLTGHSFVSSPPHRQGSGAEKVQAVCQQPKGVGMGERDWSCSPCSHCTGVQTKTSCKPLCKIPELWQSMDSLKRN